MDLDRTGRDCALHPRIFFFRAKPPCSPQAEAADPPSDRLRGRRPPARESPNTLQALAPDQTNQLISPSLPDPFPASRLLYP